MKIKCKFCHEGETFLRINEWDTDYMPHEIAKYRCDKCGKHLTKNDIYEMIRIAKKENQ